MSMLKGTLIITYDGLTLGLFKFFLHCRETLPLCLANGISRHCKGPVYLSFPTYPFLFFFYTDYQTS